MNWVKKGHIFINKAENDWDISHAQVPTAFFVNEDLLRIFYCTRDKFNRSRTTFIDVDPGNPEKIIYVHPKPILELGGPGMFDDSGIMPTWIERKENLVLYYYIGWNVGNNARYRVAHGLAVSEDNGFTFQKYSDGPIMDRSVFDPVSVSNHSIIKEEGIWKMWYMSYLKWEFHDNMYEPYYIIKYAESTDGINWVPKNKVCIDLISNEEGGIARPFVLKENGVYKMWYSYRNGMDYRNNLKNSYRIGYAESTDGIEWERKDHLANINVSETGWDSEMIAYPNIYVYKGTKYMLYNGNGFGKTGFGYAIQKEE